ncbi:nucleotidyl transferase AbiEii/AbiGii toxin family protein [Rhizobiaceae bacterium n13]|uniref:Nucleotidyl transferase AbiEii/AbiGii toxin family protein n=1 Tax=Ferirhizobium litorale TaxID=2927786 RepID=A0AAE3QDU8_9HYPH|nr:nucleotidyl transferase AbiEii/AbiGii toxin family protein [Fererhizobium litorale]MDI7864679.1 nucleotidyl transferase AbiEii/AbiGii toxin family protein [Fererhizobium litorale]MDI7922170.1 nucleotidyl transferase AbiEii/AbiGii toxin family protein [Fererhizobium litorale]
MPTDFLHNHKDFGALLCIVAEEMKVQPALVEKDYWIMHCLYGLQQLKMRFELKGGTSLSKGYRIINRFSEDIDIRIEPPEAMGSRPALITTNPHIAKAARPSMTGLPRRSRSTASKASSAIPNSTTRVIAAAASASIVRR